MHVADLNRCEYCLAAHTVLGQKAGATAAEMTAAQAGESNDPRTQAALRFSAKLVKDRGHVTSADIEALRGEGFSDEEVAETWQGTAVAEFSGNCIKIRTLDNAGKSHGMRLWE